MHLQRRNLLSNYALVDDSRLHTLVQQLEHDTDVGMLTIWTNVVVPWCTTPFWAESLP